MAPLIPLAIGLAAEFAPRLVKWVAGDEAGAAAQTVVDLAREVTGKDDPDDALAAVKADPALAAQLAQRMGELANELEKIHADDRKDARARAVAMNDRSPVWVGLFILVVWAAINGWLLITPYPPVLAPELVGRILGMIDATTMAFVLWMYGSSKHVTR
jgi:hypothetical protein